MATNDSDKFNATDILFYLRNRLLDAREQNDAKALHNLAIIFDILWDFVDVNKIRGGIGRILENFERSAYDSIEGVGWKSIIPSEEDIRSALQSEETDP